MSDITVRRAVRILLVLLSAWLASRDSTPKIEVEDQPTRVPILDGKPATFFISRSPSRFVERVWRLEVGIWESGEVIIEREDGGYTRQYVEPRAVAEVLAYARELVGRTGGETLVSFHVPHIQSGFRSEDGAWMASSVDAYYWEEDWPVEGSAGFHQHRYTRRKVPRALDLVGDADTRRFVDSWRSLRRLAADVQRVLDLQIEPAPRLEGDLSECGVSWMKPP